MSYFLSKTQIWDNRHHTSPEKFASKRRTKICTLRQWRKSVCAVRSERKQAWDELQRLEETRLDSAAWRSYCCNILTSCLVRWQAVARQQRERRVLDEGKQRRKSLVGNLMGRLDATGCSDKYEKEKKSSFPSAVSHDEAPMPKKLAKGRKHLRNSYAKGTNTSISSALKARNDKKENAPISIATVGVERKPNFGTKGSTHNSGFNGDNSRQLLDDSQQQQRDWINQQEKDPIRPWGAAERSECQSNVVEFKKRSRGEREEGKPVSKSLPHPAGAMQLRWEERRKLRAQRTLRREELWRVREAAAIETERRQAEERREAHMVQLRQKEEEARSKRLEKERRKEDWAFAIIHARFGITKWWFGTWRNAVKEVALEQQKVRNVWWEAFCKDIV